MNITLVERARSMLSGVDLEKTLWEKRVAIVRNFINRSPTSALVDNTLMEVSIGKDPSLQHIRVFGCEAHAHLPKEK